MVTLGEEYIYFISGSVEMGLGVRVSLGLEGVRMEVEDFLPLVLDIPSGIITVTFKFFPPQANSISPLRRCYHGDETTPSIYSQPVGRWISAARLRTGVLCYGLKLDICYIDNSYHIDDSYCR